MDDQTVYLDLRRKMERLLAFINNTAGTDYGACFVDGGCTMTRRDECRGSFTPGAACERMHHHGDCDDSAQKLLERMGNLLKRVHAESAAEQVSSHTFKAGGQTFSLELTPAEYEAVLGAGTQSAVS
jgi:hypothetical protein